MLKTLIDGTEINQSNINWEYQLTGWLLILGSMEHWISIVWGKLNEMMCNLKCMKYKHYPNIEIHNSKVSGLEQRGWGGGKTSSFFSWSCFKIHKIWFGLHSEP